MIRWIPKEAILAIHAELIDEHGGSQGVRNDALLQAALAHPQNLAAYTKAPSLHELAAAYALIARNRPFVDGNKRTGLMAAYMFLYMNRQRLVAPEVDAVVIMTELAASKLSEAELATWLKANCVGKK